MDVIAAKGESDGPRASRSIYTLPTTIQLDFTSMAQAHGRDGRDTLRWRQRC